MKKLITLLSVLLSLVLCAEANAKHCWQPGTVWAYETWILGPNPPHNMWFDFLGDEMILDGESVLPYLTAKDDMSNADTILYIRVEGDRIYWRYPDEDLRDWYLLYDFDLEVGETIEVSSPIGAKDGAYTSRIRCKERNYKKGDCEVLLFDEYYLGSVDNTYPAEGWWIEGVSVAMYPYACNGFGLCAGGIEIVQLNRVTLADGTVIYESPETGIETPGSDNEACEDCPSEVYNLQGQRVGLSVEGLAPGIYVRKCDDGSQKIRVK